jgi:hypothetical protein
VFGHVRRPKMESTSISVQVKYGSGEEAVDKKTNQMIGKGRSRDMERKRRREIKEREYTEEERSERG